MPFYDKRDNTIYPTKSIIGKGWTQSVHSNERPLSAGMGTMKPLSPVTSFILIFSIIPKLQEVLWGLLILDHLTQIVRNSQLEIEPQETLSTI